MHRQVSSSTATFTTCAVNPDAWSRTVLLIGKKRNFIYASSAQVTHPTPSDDVIRRETATYLQTYPLAWHLSNRPCVSCARVSRA
eukprot:m.213058 g.213058  ORF g.213058 m.213058 type:complete len:85 (+) comp19053_c0_seq20:137-391(+)